MTLKSPARTLFSALLLLLALFATPRAGADGAGARRQRRCRAAAAKPEKDPFGRETPQGMVSGLMNALAAADYARAVHFFETDTVPGARSWYVLSGPELARRFQEVLDRAGTVTTPAELSNDPERRRQRRAGGRHRTLRHGQDADRRGAAAGQARQAQRPGAVAGVRRHLARIPALSRTIADGTSGARPGSTCCRKARPSAARRFSHWLAILIAACLSFAIAWALTGLRGPIERLVRRGGPETKLSRFIEASAGPLRILIALLFFGILMQWLGVTVVARYRALFVVQLIGWLAVVWLMWRWADAAGEVILGQMSRRGQITAYSAVSFLNRAFKALLIVLLIAALLRAFGVNVTAGLAALGVGGLAIALGAQKLFENLIGSLTLVADRPVRIGDFGKFGDTLGTVEEIGIRSTRIRTLDRTVLTVPNGQLSALPIENYSQRDRYWFHPILNLRYETSPDQMRHVLQALRTMLCGAFEGGHRVGAGAFHRARLRTRSTSKFSPTSSRGTMPASWKSRRTCCCAAWTSSRRAAPASRSRRRRSISAATAAWTRNARAKRRKPSAASASSSSIAPSPSAGGTCGDAPTYLRCCFCRHKLAMVPKKLAAAHPSRCFTRHRLEPSRTAKPR